MDGAPACPLRFAFPVYTLLGSRIPSFYSETVLTDFLIRFSDTVKAGWGACLANHGALPSYAAKMAGRGNMAELVYSGGNSLKLNAVN